MLTRRRSISLLRPALLGLGIGGLLVIAPSDSRSAPQPTSKPISREQLDALVKPLIDGGWCRGMVVGIVDAQGSQVYGYGVGGAKDQLPDGATVFEIGSITKAFTGILLADAVTRKEAALDDPVRKHLPAAVKTPEFEGTAITLQHLATHTSALPRLPANFQSKDPENPYADYTVQQMYDFLSGYKLTRKPGEKSDYSNLGAGLLGHVLAHRAGKSYEELLQERLCVPLGLKETRITLTPEMRSRLAPGQDADGSPAANWDLPTLAGAGALRSTGDDMIRFLKANINPPEGHLGQALRLSHEKQATVAGNTTIGLGWHRNETDGLVWHNGQTGGYHSFAGFNTERRAGVVVLANTATDLVDAVGGNLLLLQAGEAAKPPKLRPTVKLAPPALDAYAGDYTLAPTAILKVFRKGDRLMAQLTGQPAFGIYPEAENRFYYRIVDAQLTFDRNGEGKVTGLTLHQNGQNLKAPRK
jgi:CubicO group peptidase (beta-lactamase class C family)